MTRLLLIPPDTRPPTLELPCQLARMTGAQIEVPPPEALPHFFTPGNTELLRLWLRARAPSADALIICLETLCLGGMIPARRVSDSLEVALARLEILRELKATHPALRLYAFGVVVRVAHDNDPHEEKPYYGEWGSKLRAYSTAFDQRARHGHAYQQALDFARAAVDPEVLADWLGTRQRNRELHLAALDLLEAGVLEHLCLTLDDTSEYGLAAYDRRLLEARADERDLWERFDTYPGADEVPCALLVRALRHGQAPARAWVRYGGTLGAQAGLIYEDRCAGELIQAQLRAAGCALAAQPAEADFVLAVNTPALKQANLQPDLATVDTPQRHLPAFLDATARDLEAGLAVSLADIAYPNGAERRCWTLMQRLPLAELAGYSAWNTAGNTLGSAIAFGALAGQVQDRAAHIEALFARLVDDGLYQAFIRPQLRQALTEQLGQPPSPFDLAEARPLAEALLREQMQPALEQLWCKHFAGTGLSLEFGEAHLAWPRLFTGVFPLKVKA